MKYGFFLLTLVMSCAAVSKSYQKSDHFDGKKFHNPGKNDLKSFWQVLKWKMTADTVKWPESVANKNYPFRALAPTEKVSASFINHATFFIQLPGLNVLTDPVYSERVSPFTWMGPKRVREAGLSFDTLPNVDVVIISHNHYDHLDKESLKQIDAKFHPLFLVPLGDEKLLQDLGIQNVKAMDWWEEVRVKETRFIFTPSQHWSARSLWDKNESLWGSFMINNGASKIYFAGDTGHSDHFKEIKTRLGSPDLALLPIGGYAPEWFMKVHHMGPKEAVQAHLDLGATQSLGMHFGTFQLTDEGIDGPVVELEKGREELGVSAESFKILDQGQSLFF